MSVVNPMSLVPSRMSLDVEIVNYHNKRLVKEDSSNGLRMHLLDGETVAFQDMKTGLYLTKEASNFGWEITHETPNMNQRFHLIKSQTSSFPYGIRSMSGEYLGTDLFSFLKIPIWRWTSNLGGWESFSIQVKNVIAQ
jgi:hypothetical protein